jgi:hypothetical protein
MPSAVAVPGNCFRMTSRLGALSITISGSGAAVESGSRSMTGCANRCGRQRVATRTRVPPFWIVNPYAPVRPEVYAAMTLARRSGGVNAPYSGRCPRLAVTGRGHGGQQAGPERSTTLVGAAGKTVPALASDLGRWRLRRGTGNLDPRLTQMGEGAVGDCAQAERTKRICRPAVEVASGTDLRLAVPESATPLRL